jgi:hypothetical protein
MENEIEEMSFSCALISFCFSVVILSFLATVYSINFRVKLREDSNPDMLG